MLREYRQVVTINEPGTLDGGDVLRVGDRWYVGRSARTNDEGIRQLAKFIPIQAVDFRGCLHLKSAVTAIDHERVVLNPEWVDPLWPHIEVDPDEPFAANVLLLEGTVIAGHVAFGFLNTSTLVRSIKANAPGKTSSARAPILRQPPSAS